MKEKNRNKEKLAKELCFGNKKREIHIEFELLEKKNRKRLN
jgi:hypothetical protein